VGPIAVLDGLRKTSPPPGFDPRSVLHRFSYICIIIIMIVYVHEKLSVPVDPVYAKFVWHNLQFLHHCRIWDCKLETVFNTVYGICMIAHRTKFHMSGSKCVRFLTRNSGKSSLCNHIRLSSYFKFRLNNRSVIFEDVLPRTYIFSRP